MTHEDGDEEAGVKGFGERLVDRVLALSAAAARRGMMPLRLLSAGAILFCLVGAWSVVRDPISTSRVRVGAAVASGTDDNSAQANATNETSAAQSPARVPAHFVVRSISRSGSVLFALGMGRCSEDVVVGTCPALVRSADSGRTWQQIHVFPNADSTALGGSDEPLIQPARALSHVLFTSKRFGYVYGSDLWVTKDGGASFTRVGHGSLNVVAVKQWEGKPLVLTADGCIQGLCTGRMGISRLTNSGMALASPLASVTPVAPYASASFATSGAQLVVTATGSAGTGDEPGSWKLVRTGLARISPPAGCNGTPFVAVAGRMDGKGFAALCDAALSAGTTTYSTMVSRDGMTWNSVGSGNLTLPTQGRVSLATFDGVHLVATSGGPRSASDGTTRSSRSCPFTASVTGGKTWGAPKHCGNPPPGGMDDVQAWGANEFVSLSGTTSDYWRSSSANEVWIHNKISDRGD